MPGLVPGIHVFDLRKENKAWITATSAAMMAVVRKQSGLLRLRSQ